MHDLKLLNCLFLPFRSMSSLRSSINYSGVTYFILTLLNLPTAGFSIQVESKFSMLFFEFIVSKPS